MPLPLLLPILLLAPIDDPTALIAKANTLTAAEQRCVPDPDSTDITVCGLRNADRFRVPLMVHDPGDPRYETVSAERNRLLHRTNPVQDLSPFLVGGGMAGVSVTVDTATGAATERKPAP